MARKPNQKRNNDLLKKLQEYIDKTNIPIVAEFAYLNDVSRQHLYENKELSYAIKKLIDKKEAQLERGGLDKTIDKTMAIFSLKQLGWKDIQEVSVGFNPKEIAEQFATMVSSAGTGSAT